MYNSSWITHQYHLSITDPAFLRETVYHGKPQAHTCASGGPGS